MLFPTFMPAIRPSQRICSPTSVTANTSGAYATELRYYAYGGVRYNPGNQVTTDPSLHSGHTGQRWDSGTNLFYYGARWYDPAIGRFLAADTVVPQPRNPGGLNRYSYVLNNSLKFTDPTGHANVCGATNTECDTSSIRPNNVGDTRLDPSIVVDVLVPEDGTVSMGGTLMVGAGLMGSISVAIFHIDSEGNIVMFSPSVGGGGIAGAAVEGTGFISVTNAQTVDQLAGWSVNAGGGIGAGLVAGFDQVWFMDYETDTMFTGQVYSAGLGGDVGPFFAAEIHGGFNYSWLGPIRFNIYDVLSMQRPQNQ
ncbi:MAG: RHS repeat-associated core domain-containing protein [Caldilineales bacterium]|nr:RHS repeat-associated core domain-containing protein [Caldilineales bacterium]